MNPVYFYITAAVAVLATAMVIISRNAVHALLYLIISLLATAIIFYLLGAPFAAALEVIVYAGAIMVLMVFVIMMLNQGDAAVEQEIRWLHPTVWLGPALLAGMLLVQMVILLRADAGGVTPGAHAVDSKAVGIALFSRYLLAVELASMLLLAGLVGAFHLARNHKSDLEEGPDVA
ncbi:NADH-quinone oxidoreductase subunit J [Microbulbifer sp. SAOS-129_SWC]|uniref:NADH-quinone oxidoreductase subunit J n=1 Tax=Microbulbifer sp. SAOS-129_SWC TaxID=3145235 RepID=UPI0032171A2C